MLICMLNMATQDIYLRVFAVTELPTENKITDKKPKRLCK